MGKYTLKQFMTFLLGVFLLAIGVALSTKAQIGTSPMAVLPLVSSKFLPWSQGQLATVMNLFFVFVQWLILRDRFTRDRLAQIPLSFIFGFFIDFSLFLFSWLDPESYIVKWILIILSILVGALGISLEIAACCWTLSGDGLVNLLSKEYKIEFGKVKTSFDVFLVTLAILLSLWQFGTLIGVREGTIAAAIFTGMVAKFYRKKFPFLNK